VCVRQAEQYRDTKIGPMVSALDANIRAVDEQLMAVQKDLTQPGGIVCFGSYLLICFCSYDFDV
jgi:hypothetical protein